MRGQRPEKIRTIPSIGEANTSRTFQWIAIDKDASVSLNGKN